MFCGPLASWARDWVSADSFSVSFFELRAVSFTVFISPWSSRAIVLTESLAFFCSLGFLGGCSDLDDLGRLVVEEIANLVLEFGYIYLRYIRANWFGVVLKDDYFGG